MPVEIIWGVIGGVSILALGIAVYTQLVTQRTPDLSQLQQRMSSVELLVADFDDKLQHFQRREASRRRRGQATAEVEANNAPVASLDPAERKRALRARLFAARQGGTQ